MVDTQLMAKRPPSISVNAVWDANVLPECAKKSFRSLKKSWKESQSEEAEKQAEINDRNPRMYRRRERKYEQIEDRIEVYAEKYCIPVRVVRELVHEQLLSDEASGPADEGIESPAAWKVRMAMKYDEKDLSPAALKDKDFLEVLECPWRSDEFSKFSRTIQSLPSEKSGKMKYKRVRGTLQKSSRIPLISPYDCGISREWLDDQRHNPDVAPLLADWGAHGDPEEFEGFGSGRIDGAAAGDERVVNPRFDFEGLADDSSTN
ncbi:hypothetical protein MVEN_02313000 [Mycena venus]|uniref:Uncharacterized protein n=1 Tax=Mycena venus TaxID=2733690 RepID=A0A8H7CDY6_9AGAR|nr:hypothetical protein MVEN_02313000 [Mycena venus]